MRFLKPFALVLLLAAASPACGQVLRSQPPGHETPPPPPPPPGAESPEIKTALREAHQCLFGPPGVRDHDGRLAAEKATRNLMAKPGSKEWNDAREVVLNYVRHRQEQRSCLEELERLRSMGRLTDKDYDAVLASLRGLYAEWTIAGQVEIAILRRLLGLPSGGPQDLVPLLVP